MADFGTAVRNLRPGYIAKTSTMRGYLRRHELGSRLENPNYVSGGSEPEYLYYKYEGGSRVRKTAAGDIAEILGYLKTPEETAGSTGPSANVVFDVEFVENAAWSDADSDSKRVYAFRCYQTGGTETNAGTSRTWRVDLVSGTGEDGSDADSLPDSPVATPKQRYDTGNSGADRYSQLKIDADTFEMLVSQDWEYNQVTEEEYVASSTSQARW